MAESLRTLKYFHLTGSQPKSTPDCRETWLGQKQRTLHIWDICGRKAELSLLVRVIFLFRADFCIGLSLYILMFLFQLSFCIC